MSNLLLKIKNELVLLYTAELNKYMSENNLTIDDIRERLYNNISPFGYGGEDAKTYEKFKMAVTHPSTYRRLVSDLDPNTIEKIYYDGTRDDIWAEYLNIPKNKRHTTNNNGSPLESKKVIPSEYSPTINNSDKPYLYKTLENMFKNEDGEYNFNTNSFVDEGLPLSEGTNIVSSPYMVYFGDHTIGKGFDENGLYLSVYDLWDLSPFSLYGEDESAGIGTPIHFYDRLYLDDYFDFNDTVDGGVRKTHWLPDLVVSTKPKKKENISTYKKGSKIHIKKENRGKFTAAAKKAGMSVQAYASKVLNDPNASPKLKKRANFARNAKKWKH